MMKAQMKGRLIPLNVQRAMGRSGIILCLVIVLTVSAKGVAQESDDAAASFRAAAEQGDAQAQYNLGEMYANGQGVPQDHAEAVQWYRAAGEQGLAEAQYKMGVAYETGQGIAQNDAEAIAWYRIAAEQGFAEAQFKLDAMDDKYAQARSRDSDSELAQLADSFAETEPPDESPGYEEVEETFLDFAVAQDLDNMVEMVSPSGLNEHGIDTVKEYYANDVVPFFSDFVKLHNVSGIAPAWDEYGHKGISRYLYSVTKSGAVKPFAIQLLIEDGKVVVGKVIVGECFRPHHPFC